MEKYRPVPDEIKQTPEVKKKPAIWKKFVKYTEIAALSALLSTQAIESAFAQEKGEKVDAKTKIEQLKEKAAGHIKDIVIAIKEKGQQGKMGRTPVRRWASPDQKTSTTIGYNDEQGDEARWLIHEVNEGSMRFFDKGADGSVDRVVINNETRPHGARQKSAENDLKTFDSIQNLADNASVEADLDPENVKVYEISFENGNFVIRSVDFQSGDASELTGSDAEELVSKVQGSFTNSIESVGSEISK